MRLVARVAIRQKQATVKHLVGFAPELTGGEDHRTQLPRASLLLIEANPGGRVLLYRVAQDGSFAGDTLHQSPEEAKSQAAYEYGESLGPWREVPPEVSDPVAWALERSGPGDGKSR